MRSIRGDSVMVTVTYDQGCLVPIAVASDAALIREYQHSRSPTIWAEMEKRVGDLRERCAAHLAEKYHLPAAERWDVKQATAEAIPEALLACQGNGKCDPDEFIRLVAVKTHKYVVAYLRSQRQAAADAPAGLWFDLLEDRHSFVDDIVERETWQLVAVAAQNLGGMKHVLFEWIVAGFSQAAFAVEFDISTTGVHDLKRAMIREIRRQVCEGI